MRTEGRGLLRDIPEKKYPIHFLFFYYWNKLMENVLLGIT